MNHKPFVDTLRALRQGKTLEELAEALTEAVGSVDATGKSGEITLTLKVSRLKGSGVPNAITITDKIQTKLPPPTRDPSMFFFDDENQLHRRNPNQDELFGRDDDELEDRRNHGT